MRTFTDKISHEWRIDLTVDCLRRIKAKTGVNLTQPLALDAEKQTLAARIDADVMLRCDLIFAAVSEQADAAGITDEAFASRISPIVMRAATAAFWGELTDFFRALGQEEVAEAIEGVLKLSETIRTNASGRMKEIQAAVQQNVIEEMNQEADRIMDELTSTKTKSGTSLTSSQESLESIPAR